MLLNERVFPVKRDGMEVEVERDATPQAELGHGVEPIAHENRIAARIDAAAVLCQEGALGDGIEAGEKREALVKDGAHDVAVTRAAKQLESKQRADSMSR